MSARKKPTVHKTPMPAARKTGAALAAAVVKDYPALLAEVKARIQSAQYVALRAVNKELVGLYWDIGRMIVARQQAQGWGKGVVAQLAADLQAVFPGAGGFSASNLWRMKGFFETYGGATKLAPLVREIGWSHNLLILERCKDNLEREFYLRMTRKFGWSKNVLAHQIENQSYEKSLLGQSNFERTLSPALRAQAKLAVKDEYVFDFLELGAQHSERELERALIARIEDFLRAMGGLFAFMGSQYRLEVEGKEYFIDLLLFHRRLRALVAIELKIGQFEPEFVGKMQFYLAALDEQVRQDDENPSIGIILCKEKTRTIVEYALRDARKPIGVATYAITQTLPKELKDQLPSPEVIARLLENL
ncbi:MAG: PDDEXK nuclease domain-containing protein [Comamonadaceae bacterium]|nr:PDDEXK nuclease domain-containing protein [Comamonadaceae bacterium]